MNGPTPPAPYGRRPLPERANWRRGFDVYVQGRNRILTLDEKRRIADQAGGLWEAPEAGAAERDDVLSLPAETTGLDDPSFGIAVPETLEYYRGPSTWRDRLPAATPRRDVAVDSSSSTGF